MDLNLPKAAAAAVDEAAIKLDPVLKTAIAEGGAALKSVLADVFDGYTVTFTCTITKKAAK